MNSPNLTKAETDVLVERQKQRAKWGDDHDDGYKDEELADAAAVLAVSQVTPALDDAAPEWAVDLCRATIDDRRRQCVIAAALLLAEIERIDRTGGE